MSHFIKFRYILIFLVVLLSRQYTFAQANNASFAITVLDEKQQPLEGVIIEQLNKDTTIVKTAITDQKGQAVFMVNSPGSYLFSAHLLGYETQTTAAYSFPSTVISVALNLIPSSKSLAEVSVSSRRPLIEHVQGKTIINVGASVTNLGATVLEVLQKSPGVTVDRAGGLSLQGKSQVLVLIDGRPTYLSGTDLSNRLSGMSSAGVDQIELISNPPAKYDASGTGGVINIKTKKSTQDGFNANVTLALGQGKYYKLNNSVDLNYRTGKVNAYLDYSLNRNKKYIDVYALRNYFNSAGATVSTVNQLTYISSFTDHNELKTGMDLYLSDKTTVGVALTGVLEIKRFGASGTAAWLNSSGKTDSVISTNTAINDPLKNGTVNVNMTSKLSASQDLSFDLDALKYTIGNDQQSINQLLAPGGYTSGSLSNIPTSIRIFSGKGDYSLQLAKNIQLSLGIKAAENTTNNTSDNFSYNGNSWVPDLASNYSFLYKEAIFAGYSGLEIKGDRLTTQLGLRYENTHFNGRQDELTGRSDSVFSKSYGNLFPSGTFTYKADSLNAFTFAVGRRIDRPAFQSLNPFVRIVNKYTQEQGNPDLQPQYSWNMSLSHSWQDKLITTVSYAVINNYFSIINISKGNDVVSSVYGNVGNARNFGITMSANFQINGWWALTGEADYNHKKFNDELIRYSSSIDQLNISADNQFSISKALTAELSGYYMTNSRDDLQEYLLPLGQVSAGFVQTIFKGKGSIKLSANDIFHSETLKGYTDFPGANEYFVIHRDTQYITLGFSYRFGKTLKAARRSEGSAADEKGRAGS